MRRVMFVAHPDDESLWGAGLILRYPGNWTVIAASVPRADPIRAIKFAAACAILGASPVVHDRQESPANEELPYLDEIDLSGFDHIVTHGAAGEYGHLQHKQLYRHVVTKYQDKLKTFFGYRPGFRGEIEIALTEKEQRFKMAALQCYDHITPYDGRNVPKWEALIHRYKTIEGVDFNVETYDGASP